MSKEIERKFLVTSADYRDEAIKRIEIRQTYLSRDPVVRLRTADNKAFLTIKGKNSGLTRDEWEYEIPMADAMEMTRLAGGWHIEKTRYIIPCDKLKWEVDEFHGHHQGLTVAEIELKDENQPFPRPQWLGKEVTGQPEYYNSNL